MNIIEIIHKYLDDNDYDGLFNPGLCGCVKKDLEPCDCIENNCQPGYKVDSPEDSDCAWHIGPTKEPCYCDSCRPD